MVCDKVTEKEIKEYFNLMTDQMKESVPMIDIMIKHEKDDEHKKMMEIAKKHLQELIIKKETLKNECEQHKLSDKECCEKAEAMRDELMKVLTDQLHG